MDLQEGENDFQENDYNFKEGDKVNLIIETETGLGYTVLINEEFTIENRMLTPTLKLKRKEIIKNYKQELENLYLS